MPMRFAWPRAGEPGAAATAQAAIPVPRSDLQTRVMNPSLLLLAAAAAEGDLSRSPYVLPRPEAGVPLCPADLLVLLRRSGRVLHCPHCASSTLQRWGHLGLRQRYRCRGCDRTFNEFTGTALHRLKRKDLWLAFSRCILDGLTVRAGARRIGVHRNTAFRWRHKLLRELLAGETYSLGPLVGVGATFANRRVRLLLGLDDRGRAVAGRVERWRTDAAAVRAMLQDRLEPGATLLSVDGAHGATARFARAFGHPWIHRRAIQPEYDSRIEPIPWYGYRFRRWLRRFRGVADHYLDHYLAWFRLADGRVWRGVCRPSRPDAAPASWSLAGGQPSYLVGECWESG